jgi:putative tricarboxylic transport membrane protein
MILCTTGAYVVDGGIFAVYVMLAATAVGYVMRAFGFSIVAFIVAFILTPQLEQNVLKARLITDDNPLAIFQHPIALALLALSVASVIYLGPKNRKVVAGKTAADEDEAAAGA